MYECIYTCMYTGIDMLILWYFSLSLEFAGFMLNILQIEQQTEEQKNRKRLSAYSCFSCLRSFKYFFFSYNEHFPHLLPDWCSRCTSWATSRRVPSRGTSRRRKDSIGTKKGSIRSILRWDFYAWLDSSVCLSVCGLHFTAPYSRRGVMMPVMIFFTISSFTYKIVLFMLAIIPSILWTHSFIRLFGLSYPFMRIPRSFSHLLGLILRLLIRTGILDDIYFL